MSTVRWRIVGLFHDHLIALPPHTPGDQREVAL